MLYMEVVQHYQGILQVFFCRIKKSFYPVTYGCLYLIALIRF